MLRWKRTVWVQPEDYEVVGAVLAATRRKAQLTQVELAQRLGRPQSIVSQYEAGRRRLDVVEFMLVVRTVGADPVEVFADIVRSLRAANTEDVGTGPRRL